MLNAKINAKQIDIAIAELEQQKSQIILELSHFSGIDNINYKNFDFSFIKPIDSFIVYTKEDYINNAIESNSGIQALNSLQEINKLRVEISKGSFYLKPDIGLHFELGYAGPRFPFVEKDWYRQDAINFTATIALQTNIWDGGKIKADIKKSTEELNRAVHQYEDGLNQLEKFISETLLKIELNRKNIEYYKLKQENAKLQIKQKEITFTAGSGTEKDYLQEKINLNNILIDEYRESIDFFVNYFSLRFIF